MIFRTRFLVIAACLLSAGTRADEKPGTKIAGWGEVIDPDRDCKIERDKNRFTITIPGKAHDYAAELGRWNAPRIMGSVRGDFIAEVKISGTFRPSDVSTIAQRRPYNGAGLLLISDKDNYISLHKGAVYLNDGVRHYLNFELRKDAELTISRYEVDLEDQETYLRLERRGGKFTAMASHDGVRWKAYDEPIEVAFPLELQLGVEARSSSDQSFRCTLEDFTIFRKVNDALSK
jgi:regulation of enolase protein 1 (concanavalin A-like superfamily)